MNRKNLEKLYDYVINHYFPSCLDGTKCSEYLIKNVTILVEYSLSWDETYVTFIDKPKSLKAIKDFVTNTLCFKDVTDKNIDDIEELIDDKIDASCGWSDCGLLVEYETEN